MTGAIDTLFHVLKDDITSQENIAFLGAQYHPDLHHLQKQNLILQQYFKPFTTMLEQQNFRVQSEISEEQNSFDKVLILAPKNTFEARYLIAQGIKMLHKNSVLYCAADNKAGGNRLATTLSAFGLQDVQTFSKNKARSVRTIRVEILNEKIIEQAINEGSPQPVLQQKFISQPGIFGWNKIDRGSELLTQHLPNNLKGKGADFGCGYGFLSKYVLQHCASGITEFHVIDADFRAVEVCRKNLGEFYTTKHFLWEDLTQPLKKINNLDFIIMNPPFHESKKTDIAIGASFITTAAKTLKPGGNLWMVANAHLPYEQTLQTHFKTVKKTLEDEGFKIFHSIR